MPCVYYVVQYLPDAAMGDERINIGLAAVDIKEGSKPVYAFTSDFERIRCFCRQGNVDFLKRIMDDMEQGCTTKAALDNYAKNYAFSVQVTAGRGSIETVEELMQDLTPRVLYGKS